jgi:hypothetical protein
LYSFENCIVYSHKTGKLSSHFASINRSCCTGGSNIPKPRLALNFNRLTQFCQNLHDKAGFPDARLRAAAEVDGGWPVSGEKPGRPADGVFRITTYGCIDCFGNKFNGLKIAPRSRCRQEKTNGFSAKPPLSTNTARESGLHDPSAMVGGNGQPRPATLA